MQTNNDISLQKKEFITLTPAKLKLLEFFEPKEINTLIEHFKHVFELAAFFTDIELEDKDKTSLYMQNRFIKLLTELAKEN